MSFVTGEDLQRLSSMDAAALDELDFGAVKLADDGTVRAYNRWESEMAGIDAADALGKNFFTRVACCTNNRLVYGRFKQGVEAKALDVELEYTFTYRMKPTPVVIRLLRDDAGSNWFLVMRR